MSPLGGSPGKRKQEDYVTVVQQLLYGAVQAELLPRPNVSRHKLLVPLQLHTFRNSELLAKARLHIWPLQGSLLEVPLARSSLGGRQ